MGVMTPEAVLHMFLSTSPIHTALHSRNTLNSQCLSPSPSPTYTPTQPPVLSHHPTLPRMTGSFSMASCSVLALSPFLFLDVTNRTMGAMM